MGAALRKSSHYRVLNVDNLFEAIEGNNYNLATRLIIYGTDINCVNFHGETPLIVACRKITEEAKKKEMEKFIKFISTNGADVKQTDIHGWTASMHARENGYEEVATFLEKLEMGNSFLTITENRSSYDPRHAPDGHGCCKS